MQGNDSRTSNGVTRRLWPVYSDEARTVVNELIARGESYSSHAHPLIEELETALLERFNAPARHCLFVASGTTAILTAYFALGLDRGAEVLVPSITFHATASPMLWLGLRPVFCDIDPATGLIDLNDAAARVTSRTQALMVTHLWGQLVDMRAARLFCTKYQLALLEDCSHAHSALPRRIVAEADASAFSLGTKKIVSGGLAGAVILKDHAAAARAAVLSQPPQRAAQLVGTDSPLHAYCTSGLGLSLRGSPIAAALALDHLRRLSEIVANKNATLRQVHACIQGTGLGVSAVSCPPDQEGTLYALPIDLGLAGTLQEIRSTRDAADLLLRSKGLRVSPAPIPLPYIALFKEPGASGTGFAATDVGIYPGADQYSAAALRFDTRDMYESWAEVDIAGLEDSLADLGSILQRTGL